MAIQLSPSVLVKETDLTNVVPAVATSIGAAVIEAGWGPVLEVMMINSENSLVTRFGKPNDLNASNWFAAANFLAYSNNLLVVRSDTTSQRNAVTILVSTILSIPVSTGGTNYASATVVIASPDTSGIQATADVVIVGGSITELVITNPGSGYTINPVITITDVAVTGQTIVAATFGDAVLVTGGIKINGSDQYSASFENGEAYVGEFAAKYPGSIGNSLLVSMADTASFATWAYKDQFSSAPGTSSYTSSRGGVGDELHIVVVDKDAKWSGAAGTVLEKFEYVSKASDGKKEDGSSAYYRTVLKEQSNFVWNMDHPTAGTNWGTDADAFVFASIGSTAITRALAGGVDYFIATTGQRIAGFALFTNDEAIDLSLIITGKANATIANWVIQNVAEVRKDCLAFVSPEDVSSGSVLVGNTSDIATKLIAFRDELPSSSYFVVDSGYKYQYDRYADKYRWVPLNGDIAGLCARTDETNDPWFSPAGLTRGSIKNVVKLAFSPTKTDRDNLYKNGINPVVSFPGQGVVLYGDKTGLTKPSAFDRINVRRLFIVLEKAIATAAKFQLFEINDIQTRSQFVAMVEPFLRDVKGRRGLFEFKVVCDTSNNTPQVIDTNRFVASIFIQPARSINFIELNFIATRTGVSFEEIAGAV